MQNDQIIQRPWHALKSGDTILFQGRWREVFDAYSGGRDLLVIALIDQNSYPAKHTIRLSRSPRTVTCRIH